MLLLWELPEGEVRSWLFRPAELRTVEVEAVEAVGGPVWDNFDDFGRLFLAGNRRAWRAALWLMLRRERPSLAFSILDVGAYEVRVEWEPDELVRLDASREAASEGDAEDPKADGGPSPDSLASDGSATPAPASAG